MNVLKTIIVYFFFTESLIAGAPFKLSERYEVSGLEYSCRATHDGFELVVSVLTKNLNKNILFAKITEAKQIPPSYSLEDVGNTTKYTSTPCITLFNLSLQNSTTITGNRVPIRCEWKEEIPYDTRHTPIRRAYQTLIGADFDPFAHDGEIAYVFDASKRDRGQFSDVQIVPDSWSAQITAAVNWRSENNALFEIKTPTPDDKLKLNANAASSNPIIRKMAMSLLLKHKLASSNEKMSWLKAEPTIIDVAVLTQLMLTDDPQVDILTSPAWMVDSGEQLWGGALIGAALLFTPNQKAVDFMMIFHAKVEQSKQVPDKDTIAYKKTAMSQNGYATIEGLGVELVKTNKLKNYPSFSAANVLFGVTKIIPPQLLRIDPVKQ